MQFSRRKIIELGAGSAAAATWPFHALAAPPGGKLVVGLDPEPLVLASAASIDPGTLQVSGKIFDLLFAYDVNGKLQPRLATSADVSKDGLSITLKLRPGVQWHDGKPFTADDVAFSILNVWKKYHARGYMSYANVRAVDTPDPLTAIIRLIKPAPYIFDSLSDGESQVVAKHIYAGSDVLSNPANLKPVGTGPFRFKTWQRGSFVLLERNPHYWDAPRPYLDQVYFRFLKDGAATVAALETGEIQYIAGSNVPSGQVARLRNNPALSVQTFGPDYAPIMVGFAFNLDRPLFKDVRVRQAIAHAIDRPFILKNLWQGYGTLSDSPIPPQFKEFYTGDVPKYPFDLNKAAALLDAAGHRPGPDGVRLRFTCDPKTPNTQIVQMAQFIRASLGRIGVKMDVRSQSLGEYLNRVFTRRDFDTIAYTSGFETDPALGIQRFYWSKTFQPGVPFSNATHYGTPAVDKLLEAAQVETDPVKRRALYVQVQQAVQRDVPIVPILFPSAVVLSSIKVRDANLFRIDNFSHARVLT